MTDYANAPAPRSALFDDAPTVTASNMNTTAGVSVTTASVPQTLTVHFTPAVRIARGRDGKWYGLPVGMQYGAPVPLALALRRVAIGRTVFVAREDAGTVLAAVRGMDGETSRLDA